MGIAPSWLNMFIEYADQGHVHKGDSILDIGASELFCSDDPASLNKFLARFGAEPYSESELARVADRSFAAELFTRAGFQYTAIDYANFPGVIRLDLNRDELPREHHGRHQFVSNSGTSEHILNQYNVFKVIHDATALDGVMYHGIPSFGEYEHGILDYTPKFFWGLAQDNEYEIIRFAGSADPVQKPLPDEFMKVISFNIRPITQNVWFHVLLKKRKMQEFKGANDPSFSPDAVDPRAIIRGGKVS